MSSAVLTVLNPCSDYEQGMEDDESAVMKICMELRATAALEGDDIYLEGEVGAVAVHGLQPPSCCCNSLP